MERGKRWLADLAEASDACQQLDHLTEADTVTEVCGKVCHGKVVLIEGALRKSQLVAKVMQVTICVALA